MIKDKSIFIKNIYYMLSYAFKELSQKNFDHVETEKFENIHNLFAVILFKGISQQLKQGLYRQYLEKKENLSLMRGKIDVVGTVRNKLTRKQMLTCEYDELSENNLFNQILKTTVTLLLRHVNVSHSNRNDLKKVMMYFSNVDSIDPISIRWSSILFQRNNQSYQMLISICQFIVEGMLLTTNEGQYKVADFIHDQKLSRLYEKFILEYYRKEHPQLKVTASRIDWALDDGIGFMLPNMQSDIMLSRGEKTLIIDAKYYTRSTQVNFDSHKMHSGNLYQIFTYVKNHAARVPHVSGMLLYAKTDEEIQPDGDFQMSGNKISVRTLDLNQEFEGIKKQLDHVVEEHFSNMLI
jgi:5-methylcytosine-specific restriction enzyme subunit McrC